MRIWIAPLLLFVALAHGPAVAAPTAGPTTVEAPPTAPVRIDGDVLFRVRGLSSFPASRRAAKIADRIGALAADPSFDPSTLSIVDEPHATDLRAGDVSVVSLFDADARVEDMERQTLALAYRMRIAQAIVGWREARTPARIRAGVLRALAATAGLILALGLLAWLSRRIETILERRYRARVGSIGIQSFEIVQAERLWAVLRNMRRGLRTLVAILLVWAWLVTMLDAFPWTRAAGIDLFEWVLEPLRTLGAGFVAYLPNLVFLAILFVLARLALRFLFLFFDRVDRGAVRLNGFDREWAWPTYRIARILVVAFTLVMAYPYIPGSDSEAFKGLSLFLGLVFSLGASSVVSNTLAGYSMIYRRTFKVGDRVKIGAVVGDVVEMRLQVTHLRSPKNEEVIVPNSTILGSEVVNYSSFAREAGLILHTEVGIGYETPWRQVEAMLLLAAERTPGLRRDPPPFVEQKALGDFAVTYELNVRCDEPRAMLAHYTALHRSILDIFNEHGVQIMTPNYESDPKEPKLVPKDQWWAPPAKP